MANEIVGLENVPNVYISKVSLEDNSSDFYDLIISLLVLDVRDSGGFIWKDNEVLYNFLKIGIIQTSNLTLASLIRDGSLNPKPSEVVKSPHYKEEETKIKKIPISTFLKSQTGSQCFYNYNSKFRIPFSEDVIVFAVPYIDTRGVAEHYRIDLGSRLSNYLGAVTSEIVMENGKVPELTSLFLQPNGQVWPGPVRLDPSLGFVAGSFQDSSVPTRLKQIKVQNIKLADNRTRIYKDTAGITHKKNAIISNLEYSINDKIDLMGLFSINFKQFAIQKTKYGRAMLKISPRLFHEFLVSMQINSLSVIRQQVKTLKITNSLGTTDFGIHQVDSYDYLATTIDNKDNRLKNTENLQQIYLNPDYKIRHYQFNDPDNTAKTKGQYSYKVKLSVIDKSQEFLNTKLQGLQRQLSNLKQIVYVLNKRTNFDYKTNKLKNGKEVPASILELITAYCTAQSYFKKMSAFEINYEINQRVSSWVSANYTPNVGEKLVNDFDALLTEFARRFKISAKFNRTSKPKNIKKAFIPNLIVVEKQFKKIIQFCDYRRFYQFLETSQGFSESLSREKMRKRSDFEIERFFNSSKSSFAPEFSTLDNSVSQAITDTNQASQLFLSPLKFHFDSSEVSLRDLTNIDNENLTVQFLNSIKVAEVQIRPWRTSQKKSHERQKVPANKQRQRRTRRSPVRKQRRSVFSPSFKIPSFTIKTVTKEWTVDSSEYLGYGSAFVNPSGNIRPPVVSAIIQKTANLFNATQIPTNSNKLNFDLKTSTSNVGSFIASSKFNKSKLTKAPVAWKALVCSRSPAAKNEILSTSGDVLQNPETKITSEIVFQTSQKLEMLAGYETDLNGDLMISAPIWVDMDFSNLPTIGAAICRLKYAEIPELGIIADKAFQLPVVDELFIVSDQLITTDITERPTFSLAQESINMNTKNRLSQNIKFATTNIVKQNIRKNPIRPVRRPLATATFTSRVVPHLKDTSSDKGGSY